jgi:diguanylate cyclase (GGDEF)-like protein
MKVHPFPTRPPVDGDPTDLSLHDLLRAGLVNLATADDDVRGAWLEEIIRIVGIAERRLCEQGDRIDKLESMLIRDELTGLLNRRGLREFMRRVLAASERSGGHGVIAFLDLDKFKEINDRVGHEGGDEVLRQVAKVLMDNTRGADVVGRLGGDEFVVMLVDSGWRQGHARARHLQRMINRSFARYGQQRIPLHTSLGVAHYKKGDDVDDLLSGADEAMYADKRERQVLVHISQARISRSQSETEQPI